MCREEEVRSVKEGVGFGGSSTVHYLAKYYSYLNKHPSEWKKRGLMAT